jgi:hypothetical protein
VAQVVDPEFIPCSEKKNLPSKKFIRMQRSSRQLSSGSATIAVLIGGMEQVYLCKGKKKCTLNRRVGRLKKEYSAGGPKTSSFYWAL